MAKRRIKNNLYICHAHKYEFTKLHNENIALIEQSIEGCQVLTYVQNL